MVLQYLALGEVDCETMINVSANSHSSSLLLAHERTIAIEPSIGYVGQEAIIQRRLETILKLLPASDRILLKIDTQGYERSVIGGPQRAFSRIAMVQMELA